MTIRTLACGISLSLMLTLATGCGPKATEKPKPAAGAHDEHAHEGPHKGAIAEWGEEEYHAEFTVDHGKKEATVYILGGDVKTPKPIAADKISLSIKTPAFQVELKAAPLAGEPAGSSSVFVGQHDNFGKEQEFAGTISGVVKGTPYSGDFKEEADDHDHKKK